MMLPLPLLFAQAPEIAEAAASGERSFHWMYVFNPAVVWVLIPISAILAGTVAKVIQRSQEHRERMAMIAAGLHPDFPPEPESFEDDEEQEWRGINSSVADRSSPSK